MLQKIINIIKLRRAELEILLRKNRSDYLACIFKVLKQRHMNAMKSCGKLAYCTEVSELAETNQVYKEMGKLFEFFNREQHASLIDRHTIREMIVQIRKESAEIPASEEKQE